MNKATNVTRARVRLVWLSAVTIALMLVLLNIAPVAAQSTEMVMFSNREKRRRGAINAPKLEWT